MKRALMFFLILLFVSCNNSKSKIIFTEKVFYSTDSIKMKGRFINDTIKDGLFYSYFPSGEISSIRVYENNILKKDGYFFMFFHKNRKVATYRLMDSEYSENNFQYAFDDRGDTIAYFLLNRSLYFFPKNLFKRLEIRNCKLSYDSLGNITEFTGSFDSLEREDSLVIVNDYPDFVKKAMEWKEKK